MQMLLSHWNTNLQQSKDELERDNETLRLITALLKNSVLNFSSEDTISFCLREYLCVQIKSLPTACMKCGENNR